MASPKYSTIQVYNKQQPGSAAAAEEPSEDNAVISGFCDEKTEAELVQILMKNISTTPIKLWLN